MLKKRNSNIIFAAGFVMLNFILKFIFIDSRDIAMDEPFSIWLSQNYFNAIFTALKGGNDSALYYIFLHFWIKLFGIGAVAVRIPSVIFSSLTAGIIYYTGARFFSRKAGFLAAFIFTFSTMQIYFSHEARVYALFEMLAAWNMMLCLAILKDAENRRLYLWLFICDLLLIYSHYLGWMIPAVQVFILMLMPVRNMIWKPLLIVLLLLLICYIPNFAVLFSRIGAFTGGTWVHKPQFSELYGNINRFLNSRYVTAMLLLIAMAGVIFLYIKHKVKEVAEMLKQNSYWIVMLFFLLPYLLMFVISFRFPMFLDRYILFATPALYLTVALFIELIAVKKWLYFAFASLLLASMLLFFELNPDNHRRVSELAGKVKEMNKQGSLVLISPEYSCLELAYYYDQDAFRNFKATYADLRHDGIYPARTLEHFPPAVLNAVQKIIYVDCGAVFAFGDDVLYGQLKQRYVQIDSTDVYSIYKIRQFLPK
jgi:mannosyltransferase